MLLLIDGDILAYAGASVNEYRSWVATDIHTGARHHFKSKRECDDFIKKAAAGVYTQEILQYLESMDVGNYLDRKLYDAMEATGQHMYQIYLTHSDRELNFRHKTESYKANRKDKVKPLMLDVARMYLRTEHEAEVVSGYEADDKLGIMQDDETIICSIDKDMWMIPGNHYDLRKKVLFNVSDPGELWPTKDGLIGTGFKWFCAQMLMGDSADNIKGIPNIGPKKTMEILDKHTSNDTLWCAVVKHYVEHLKDEAGKLLDINAQLLWIWRKENDSYRNYIEG